MATGLHTLKIEELAIHLIQRTTKAAPAPAVLSEALTELTDENRGFLQDRFRTTLKKARPVVEDPELPNFVPEALRSYFNGSQDLLATSQALANQLQDTQQGSSPSGLLLVARCVALDIPSVVIAKLEHERGARTNRVKTAEGKTVYDMEYLQDLFLTQGSEVYKVALFSDPLGSDTMSGAVVDKQVGGQRVAAYFMSTFLGCNFVVRADVMTEKFFTATQRFVAGIADPARRARYQVAVLAELRSNDTELSPGKFARSHLSPDEIGDFSKELQLEGIGMQETFEKDSTLVAPKIAAMEVAFEHGVVALIPPAEFGAAGHASMETMSDGRVKLEIHDEVRQIGSKGSFKPSSPDEGQ